MAKNKGDKKQTLVLTNRELELAMTTAGLGMLRTSREIPIGLSYALAMFIKGLETPMEVFNKIKGDLIKTFADRDEKGKLKQDNHRFKFTKKADEFQAEYEKLQNIKVDLKLSKLSIKLSEIPTGILTADDIISLGSIIDFIE